GAEAVEAEPGYPRYSGDHADRKGVGRRCLYGIGLRGGLLSNQTVPSYGAAAVCRADPAGAGAGGRWRPSLRSLYMTMIRESGYTIGKLAEAGGVTPRAIRFYTAEGLLPPPDTRGRFARYSEIHLLRLKAIARLKRDYLPLSIIRERLEGLTDAQIAGLS